VTVGGAPVAETPHMEAFILAKQDQVLGRAVTALRDADDDALPGEVHRLIGTLGTYGLAEAVALLRPLDDLLRADADAAAIAERRSTTLRSLEAVVAEREASKS
jgi:HPt (histidine-containing phosphotransfer) domain-containing protein